MKVRSWLSTCSSSSSTSTSAAYPLPNFPYSDPSSDLQTPSSTSSSSSSIQSNLSLLTLPSVPSLQKLSLSPDVVQHSLNPTYTSSLLTSLSSSHVNFLTLHNKLLYAAFGSQIHVYETISNTLFDTFNVEKPSSGSVKSISFSNGKIFTAHQDCRIRVWTLNFRLKRHKLIATLPTLEDRLLRFILPQNYIKIRRHKKKLWIEHHDAVSSLGTYKNSIISVSWDRSIKTWESHNLKCMDSVNGAHDDAINAVIVSGEGLVYTGSADKRIRVWRSEEKKYELIATLDKHKSAVNALALTNDGSVLFSGSCDRSILVWEREDSANHMVVTGALRGHGKAVLCLINVQEFLMSGSADRTVRVWRRDGDGRFCCLAVLDGHRTPVRSLAAAESDGGGVKVFSGSFDGEIRVWQVELGSVGNYL